MDVLFGYQKLMEIVEDGFIKLTTIEGLSHDEQRTLRENCKK